MATTLAWCMWSRCPHISHSGRSSQWSIELLIVHQRRVDQTTFTPCTRPYPQIKSQYGLGSLRGEANFVKNKINAILGSHRIQVDHISFGGWHGEVSCGMGGITTTLLPWGGVNVNGFPPCHLRTSLLCQGSGLALGPSWGGAHSCWLLCPCCPHHCHHCHSW